MTALVTYWCVCLTAPVTYWCACLTALVSALSAARGDVLHSDAVYHLRVTGGRRPAVDRVRVSRLLPAPTVYRQSDGEPPQAVSTSRGSLPSAPGGERQAPSVTEYSAGQMYFTPRMLFVGGSDQTEQADRTGSRSSVSTDSQYSRRSDRARRPRDSSQRIPRPSRRRDSPRRQRSASAGRRSRRYETERAPPTWYPVPEESRSHLYRSPRYGEETECPRTARDPDGDCIKGEADTDYPTLQTIPRTGFSCRGRPAGFYADVETRCQVRTGGAR